jgi:hypothetical protein
MRILFVYWDYKSRRKPYGSMMEECGHKVIYCKSPKMKKNGLTIKAIKKAKPDVLWLLNPFYVDNNKKAIEYARDKKIPIIMYGTVNPSVPWNEWMTVWNKIDFLFIHHKACSKFLSKQGLNSYYMPIGFYPHMYNKRSSSKSYDVSFCGNVKEKANRAKDKRIIYMQSLHNHKTIVYGASFKGKLKKIPVKEYSTHGQQSKVYARTRINIDLPFFSRFHKFYKNICHIKNRFFEIPATRNFMITARDTEMLGFYDESMVGFYDDNVESFRDTVERYLKDKKIRQKMAAKAYKYVHENHTFKHRFEKIFDILKRDM